MTESPKPPILSRGLMNSPFVRIAWLRSGAGSDTIVGKPRTCQAPDGVVTCSQGLQNEVSQSGTGLM